jgi:hypothetical protein
MDIIIPLRHNMTQIIVPGYGKNSCQTHNNGGKLTKGYKQEYYLSALQWYKAKIHYKTTM